MTGCVAATTAVLASGAVVGERRSLPGGQIVAFATVHRSREMWVDPGGGRPPFPVRGTECYGPCFCHGRLTVWSLTLTAITAPGAGLWDPEVNVRPWGLTPPVTAAIAVTAAAVGAVQLRWWWGGRQRWSGGHCPDCGYDLRATPGRCPECGRVAAAGRR